MLDARFDVVSVCTPSEPAHHTTVMAAQAGVKAVLCEKPLAMSWARMT
jgi:predicted dehydrogenase